MSRSCEHLGGIDMDHRKVAEAYECAECVTSGDRWVHLRTCQECGITLCCDSSPNKHATRHFETHAHPVIISAEPNEFWAWCYVDKRFLKYNQ